MSASSRHGLSLDPACFVPALRACSGFTHPAGDGDGSLAADRAADSAADRAAAAAAKRAAAVPRGTTGSSIFPGMLGAEMQVDKRGVEDETGGLRQGPARGGMPGRAADRGGGLSAGGGDSGGGGAAPSDVQLGQEMEELKAKSRSRTEEIVRHPSETAASLLRRMEAEAGVIPDAWCSNVAMEVNVTGKYVVDVHFAVLFFASVVDKRLP